MRIFRATALIITIALFMSSAAFAKTSTKTTKHHSSAKSSKTSKSRSRSGKKAWQAKGQKSIDSQRTREIQEALIRDHYMNGEPTGNMDAATKAALTKLQGDNGWQTKVVPDSRALIKLGLGPNQSNLLNPDTAALSTAAVSRKSER